MNEKQEHYRRVLWVSLKKITNRNKILKKKGFPVLCRQLQQQKVVSQLLKIITNQIAKFWMTFHFFKEPVVPFTDW